jgi:hypothetical protein
MISASNAVLAAAGFLGLTAMKPPATRPEPIPDEPDQRSPEEPTPSADLLSPGEPYFEAVAEALRRTGYLAS